MSWSVAVYSDDLPNVKEIVSSFSNCPGNLFMCVVELTGKKLRDMSREEAIEAIYDVIKELDKGNDGKFNDEWAVSCDKKWSNGEETMTFYREVIDNINKMSEQNRENLKKHCSYILKYETYTGFTVRDNIRKDAVRFFLYYKSGYEVKFEW